MRPRLDALAQPTRRAAYERIVAEPGIRTGTLARRLGVDHKTARHHLARLRAAELVWSEGQGQRRHFATGHVAPDRARLLAEALSAPSARKVHAHLLAHGPRDLRRLAAELGLAVSTVSASGARLRRAGLLERRLVRRKAVLRALPLPPPEPR